jgi:mono/diheme cytochrome c family protein
MRGFILGVIVTLVVLGGGIYAAAINGFLPANADSPPSAFETKTAMRSLHASIRRDDKGLTDPVAMNAASLSAGMKLYAQNCAVCHGAADGNPSKMAQGFYIGAPMLAKDGVTDDPEAETYWKITHGIRYTAMPAFGTTLSDTERWQITQFVAHMDKLPADVEAGWKAIPSAATFTVSSATSANGASSNTLSSPPAPSPVPSPTRNASSS